MPWPDRRQMLRLGLATTLGCQSLVAADASELLLSHFSEEVTCPIGHPLMGGGIAPAKEVADPLLAHGVILHGAAIGKPVVILAIDWCEIRHGAYEAWRKALAEAVQTDPARILVMALHQHDAPIADLEAEALLREQKARGSICDPDFHDKIVRRIATAAGIAIKSSTRVTHLGTGQAEVEQVASNRRYKDAQSIVRYNRMSATRDEAIRAAEVGTIDPHLKCLSFWNNDKPLLALHAYAVHPMSYYGRGSVSADFVGLARKQMQAKHPKVPQIYISGCSGNVTAGKYNDGATDNRARLAERLAKAMATAWDRTKTTPLKPIRFRVAPLALKARDEGEFAPAQLQKRLASDQARPFQQCLAALGLSWQQRVAAKKPIDVPVIDFGPAAFLLLPAESYVEYQLFAQEQRPQDFVFVAGYGECGPGYIPIERAWKENDSNLTDWCWVPPGSEAIMKAAITQALKAD